jgi:hypothetical protein
MKGEEIMNRKTSMVFLAIGFAIFLVAPVAMAQQQYVFQQKGRRRISRRRMSMNVTPGL